MTTMVSAAEMARAAGVSPKRFRAALRKERFPWHQYNDRWTAERGSDRHLAMQRVLQALLR